MERGYRRLVSEPIQPRPAFESRTAAGEQGKRGWHYSEATPTGLKNTGIACSNGKLAGVHRRDALW